MQRLNDRSVELTEFEAHLQELAAEDWTEGTDPQEFVLNQAAAHGEVVQDDFVTWLCDSMILGSVHGYAVGTAYAGSTIADVAVGPGFNRLVLTLADGRTVTTP